MNVLSFDLKLTTSEPLRVDLRQTTSPALQVDIIFPPVSVEPVLVNGVPVYDQGEPVFVILNA